MDNKVAIIIGNGKSRSVINLDDLLGQGTIFGCNALYRDWNKADYLVAIDERMIDEIQTRLPLKGTQAIFPDEVERWEDAAYNPARRRNNAGMVAMKEAIKLGHNIIYCLGFDFILEGDESVDNMYKGQTNYEPHTQSNAADNYYRIKYLEWFLQQYPDVQFAFVIPEGKKTKPIDADNLVGVTIPTFLNKINN